MPETTPRAVGGAIGFSAAGQNGTNGNIWLDPMFCDVAGGVLSLRGDSPCAEVNNPGCGQIGALGVGCSGSWLVRADGSGDFPTIQDAINAAVNGETVVLADGTYTGTGNRDLDFGGKAITVRSRSLDASLCLIDCQAGDTDPHHGFDFVSGETPASVLEYVTVTGAYQFYGGAINIANASSPTIRHCVLRDNSADSGAGILIGGAIHNRYNDSVPHFTDCLLTGNSAPQGGAVFDRDGALSSYETCTFVGNSSADGAAIRSQSGSVAVLVRCVLAFSPLGAATAADGTGTVNAACCDRYSGVYSLGSVSHCLPALSPCGLRIGAYGEGCAVTAVDDPQEVLPSRLTLAPAVPNPFNPMTVIRYELPTAGTVRLEVFDVSGRRVAILFGGDQSAGIHEVTWQAQDDHGRGVSSGLYFVRLQAAGETQVQKTMLAR